jgi:uncharacterized protein (TIGR04551 family)
MFLRPAATPLAVLCASLLVPLAASAQPVRPGAKPNKAPPQAQTQAPAPAPAPAAAPGQAPAATATPRTDAEREALRREILQDVEGRFDTVKEEIRDEVRAAVTSANAAQSWEEEFRETRPELEFFEAHGYLRTRMELFDKFNLGQDPDRSIYPTDPIHPDANTQAFADLRLRFEPTLNVAEQVRIKAQVDILDNVVLGSTPDYGSRAGYSFLVEGQRPPQYAENSWTDSIAVKRAWAEVRTPFGELRFGRMGTHWGLGVLANDGNCLDCDHGDTVDRILFAAKIADHVIAPAIDFVSEGVTSGRPGDPIPTAQPIDLSQGDDARDYVLAIARKDDDEEMRKKRLAGQETFFNYGLYFIYRTQSWDAPGLNAISGYSAENPDATPSEVVASNQFVPRDAWAVIPDLWLRLVHKSYRAELEFVTVQGKIGNWSLDPTGPSGASVATQDLTLEQYGGVLQNELSLLDDDLAIGLELGYASGDPAHGFGNFPGRGTQENPAGSWEGPQFNCPGARCSDSKIQNFQFDRDYRVDMILFREILGGVTDATYVKPSLRYDVTEGLNLNLGIIYSQVNEGRTTPTGDKPLGVEIDAGVLYQSEDNFVAGLRYGVLFPMSGLDQVDTTGARLGSSTAQAIRGTFAVTY